MRSRSNWNLKVLVFKERGKPEYPEKNLSEQGREPTTNSTHIWRRRQDSNPGHIGGRRVLSPLRHPCSPSQKSISLPLDKFLFLVIRRCNHFLLFIGQDLIRNNYQLSRHLGVLSGNMRRARICDVKWNNLFPNRNSKAVPTKISRFFF